MNRTSLAFLSAACLAFVGAGPRANAEEPAAELPTRPFAGYLESVYGESVPPEGARMLTAILSGSRMGSGEGWFGPAETRFTYPWLAARLGVDESLPGIPRERFDGAPDLFATLDRNRDGVIQPADLDWSDSNPYVEMSYALNRIFRRLDAAGDGALTKEEWSEFFDKASEGSGKLSAKDFSGALLAGYSGGFTRGDAPTTEMLLKGLFASEIGSMEEGPKVGDKAPLFTLRPARGGDPVAIGSLIGEKPLVLVFGNFTCGPFRSFYPAVDALQKTYGDRANFLMVYVREAHPEDGWKMESNTKAGVAVSQPRSFEERVEVAGQFCQRLDPSLPVVVDEVNDPVGHAYSGMPARLYIIDRDGRVAFKSGRGPFGFKPPELEQALAMQLLEIGIVVADEKEGSAVNDVEAKSDEAAWNLLPAPIHGRDLLLPAWAKAVATELPRTAAALLQLDHAQRTRSPLDPKLRAEMRWVIADVNRCEYAKRTALADLRAAGASAEEVARFLAGPADWTDVETDALVFAMQHSLDAPAIDDALFARLRERHGDKGVAAMVLLGAYGNFQDRLLLGLGVEPEGDVPLPPLAIEFAPDVFQTQPIFPPGAPAAELVAGGNDVISGDGDWGSVSYAELQSALSRQRARQQRLPTPSWDEVVKGLPAGFNARPTRIVWNLVCMGYVPELAVPWTTATRTMWTEAPQDRVFEELLFWVQTRAVRCNYCMGHCEMLLEVAGLDSEKVTERLQALASDDWSAFPEKEQRAFAYARKLTKTPWDLTAADFATLERDLGKKEAMATFFWLCRGLYMTRVSDGFQLRLESDNVFADYAPPPPAKK